MKRLIYSATFLLASYVSAAGVASAAPTVHAGEWQTRNDDGPVNLICARSDIKFDEPTMTKLMASIGAKCGKADFRTLGPTTSYNVTCEVAGGRMTLHSTITTQGFDAYVTRSQSHFEGGATKVPDMDMTQVSNRLGPCKPGDRPAAF